MGRPPAAQPARTRPVALGAGQLSRRDEYRYLYRETFGSIRASAVPWPVGISPRLAGRDEGRRHFAYPDRRQRSGC